MAGLDRRRFLRGGAALAGGALVTSLAPSVPAHAARRREVRTVDLTHRLVKDFPDFYCAEPVISDVTGAGVQVWVVPTDGGEPAGPFPAVFTEVPGQPLGLYLATVDIATPGPTSFVAVTADQRAGADAIQVATPEISQLSAPGQEAIDVPTPTTADPLGVERLCTAQPPCTTSASATPWPAHGRSC